MTSAAERLKRILGNALERVCVLEAQLEERDETIRNLEDTVNRLLEMEVHEMPELEDEVRPDPVEQTDHAETLMVVPDSHRANGDTAEAAQEPDDGAA